MPRRWAAPDQIPPGLRPPDFYLIGQQKSGTSTIWAMLSQHPRVKYGRVKENFYFNKRDCHKPIKKYLEIMNNERLLPSHVLGDFNANNMGCVCCAEVFHDLNPRAKILVMLRAPVQRSYSRYLEQSMVHDPNLNTSVPHRTIVLGPKGFHAFSDAAVQTIKLCLSLGKPLLFCLQMNNVMVVYTEEMDENLVTVVRLVEKFLGLEPFDYRDLRADTKFNTRGCYGWDKAHTEQCQKSAAEQEEKSPKSSPLDEDMEHLARFFLPMLREVDELAEQGLVRRPPAGWGRYKPRTPKDRSSEH
eukprot:jgi/Mesvir1/9425/Mv01524-RA.1